MIEKYDTHDQIPDKKFESFSNPRPLPRFLQSSVPLSPRDERWGRAGRRWRDSVMFTCT